MLSDARLSGMDAGSMAALAEDLRETGGVFETNVPAVLAFVQVTTQWRTAIEPIGMGLFRTRWIGLDYQGVKVALDTRGVEITADLFWRLQAMEQAAIAALNGWSK